MFMHVGIRFQGHFTFLNRFQDLFNFMELSIRPIIGKGVEIQMLNALFDMLIDPPTQGLKSRISGIHRAVAVAIVASPNQNLFYRFTGGVQSRYMLGTGTCTLVVLAGNQLK
jgi:hypothetical protein